MLMNVNTVLWINVNLESFHRHSAGAEGSDCVGPQHSLQRVYITPPGVCLIWCNAPDLRKIVETKFILELCYVWAQKSVRVCALWVNIESSYCKRDDNNINYKLKKELKSGIFTFNQLTTPITLILCTLIPAFNLFINNLNTNDFYL